MNATGNPGEARGARKERCCFVEPELQDVFSLHQIERDSLRGETQEEKTCNLQNQCDSQSLDASPYYPFI